MTNSQHQYMRRAYPADFGTRNSDEMIRLGSGRVVGVALFGVYPLYWGRAQYSIDFLVILCVLACQPRLFSSWLVRAPHLRQTVTCMHSRTLGVRSCMHVAHQIFILLEVLHALGRRTIMSAKACMQTTCHTDAVCDPCMHTSCSHHGVRKGACILAYMLLVPYGMVIY